MDRVTDKISDNYTGDPLYYSLYFSMFKVSLRKDYATYKIRTLYLSLWINSECNLKNKILAIVENVAINTGVHVCL